MSEHIITENMNGDPQQYAVPTEEWIFHTKHVPDMLAPHLGGPLGLAMASFKPISRPYQRLAVTHHETSPLASLGMIHALGERVVGTARMEEFIEAYRARTDLAAARTMDMDQGLRSGIISNHLLLHDVAVVPALELLALGQESYISRSAVVMSKAITRLSVDTGGFGIMPAPDALSLTGASFYSVPKTRSSYMANISSSIASMTNPPMLEELHRRIEKGGIRVAIAPSGSTDKEEDGALRLQRMNQRTTEVLASLDRILTFAINLDAAPGEPWFKIGEYTGDVRNNPDAAHELMETVAADVAEITGKPAHYEQERFYEKDEFAHARDTLARAAHRTTEELTRAGRRIARGIHDRRHKD